MPPGSQPWRRLMDDGKLMAVQRAQPGVRDGRSRPCPSAEELDRFLRSVSDADQHAEIADHLSICQRCRARAEQVAEHTAWTQKLRHVSKARAEAAVDVNVPLARLNELLSDFEVLREIGRGGMGIVFEARQISLNRRVALKVLPALLGAVRPDAVRRFEREATLLAHLQHTNIIPVFDFGEADGTLYYVMQFVEGHSLAEILRNVRETGTLDVVLGAEEQGESARIGSSANRRYFQRVAQWIAEVADGLHYAHEQGVVHRDIKPSNLLLADTGRLTISDFGLARHVRAETLTTSASLLGTARYMAPEQVDEHGPQVDRRADVYGLGATLYELLAFQPMFAAADDREVLDCVLNREPAPPRRFMRQVPRELETICLKATEKDRAKRYPTAKALRDDLERWVLGLPIQARHPSVVTRATKFIRRRKALSGALAVAMVLFIAIGLTLSGWRGSQREAADARAQAETLADQADGLALEAWVRDVQAELDAGRFATGLQKAETGLARWPGDLELRHVQATGLLFVGEHRRAIEVLEGILAEAPDDWRAHVDLAHVFLDQGDRVKAAYHREQVERLLPDSPAALITRARLEPDPQRAAELYSRALEIIPYDMVCLYERSQAYAKLGRYEEALLDADRALAVDHSWWGPHEHRSRVLFHLGRFEEALTDIRRAIELKPEWADAWVNAALIHYRLGQFPECEAAATECLRLNSDDLQAFKLRGNARLCLGRWDEAIKDLTTHLPRRPTDTSAMVLRGMAYELAGAVEPALADYTRAASVQRPDTEDATAVRIAPLCQCVLLRQLGRADEAAALSAALHARVTAEENGDQGTDEWCDASWVAQVFGLLAGDLTADELLAAATDDRQRAAAHYWIGRKLLLTGREAEAIQAFTACVTLDRTAVSLECDFAHASLRQLERPTEPGGEVSNSAPSATGIP